MIKTSMLATAALVATFSAYAQLQSGKVLYEETMKMNVKLEGDAAQYANLFPKEQKIQQVLYFAPDAALFQPAPKEAPKQEPAPPHEGDVMLINNVQVNTSQDKIYTGIKDGKSVEQHDFMGRKFIVESDIAKAPWKMTGNQKTILDYPCQEAVMINDKDTTTAWFTTAIPVSAGPHGWTGLPGLILAASRNSNLTITATSVVPGPVEAGIIVQPKSGKKVTKEEFKAIVEAKKKEMGDMGNGGGQMIIHIKEN